MAVLVLGGRVGHRAVPLITPSHPMWGLVGLGWGLWPLGPLACAPDGSAPRGFGRCVAVGATDVVIWT